MKVHPPKHGDADHEIAALDDVPHVGLRSDFHGVLLGQIYRLRILGELPPQPGR
jgi:hypothetical protein